MDDQQDERNMADAVSGYLAEHPAAMDTLEGIAEWWLMRQRVRADVERLRGVLDHLVAAGKLETSGTGESTRYRLRHRDVEQDAWPRGSGVSEADDKLRHEEEM